MVWIALFARRSPPRLSRCRLVLPLDAGIGLTPVSAAKAGLPVIRCRAPSPAPGSTPRVRRWTSGSAGHRRTGQPGRGDRVRAMIRTCGWLSARRRRRGVPPEQDRSPCSSSDRGRRWRAGSGRYAHAQGSPRGERVAREGHRVWRVVARPTLQAVDPGESVSRVRPEPLGTRPQAPQLVGCRVASRGVARLPGGHERNGGVEPPIAHADGDGADVAGQHGCRSRALRGVVHSPGAST